MYILHDLLFAVIGAISGWKSNQDTMRFESLDELLGFWFHWIGTGFDQLNITGNDTFTYYKPVFNFVKGEDGLRIVDYIKTVYYRRFMVCDQYGRSLNLIEMGLQPKPVTRKRFYYYGRSGSKCVHHRFHGPSGGHRVLSLACPVEYELADGTVLVEPPVRTKAKITTNDIWDYIDSQSCAKHSKSWKDQTRAGRQCLKKIKNNKRRNKAGNRPDSNIWANLAADGFPIDTRLLEESGAA